MFFRFYNKVSNKISGFFKNPFYKYIYIKIFWRNKYVLFSVFAIFSLIFLVWYLWLYKIVFLGDFSKSFDIIKINIYFISKPLVIPFLGTMFSLLNLLLAYFIYKRDRFSASLLIFNTLFINIILLLTALYYIFSFGL